MVENHVELEQTESEPEFEQEFESLSFNNGNWHEITGGAYQLKKFMTKPNLRGITVRGSPQKGFIFIKNGVELGWLTGEVKNYNLRYKRLDNRDQPLVKKAACGVNLTEVSWFAHERACKSCRSVKGLAPKQKNVTKVSGNKKGGETKSLFKLPGLPDMSMNGVLSLAKQRVDEALALSVQYADLVVAIEGMQKMEEEFNRITEGKEEHIKAIQFFMNENK